jgi:hypothetical protein
VIALALENLMNFERYRHCSSSGPTSFRLVVRGISTPLYFSPFLPRAQSWAPGIPNQLRSHLMIIYTTHIRFFQVTGIGDARTLKGSRTCRPHRKPCRGGSIVRTLRGLLACRITGRIGWSGMTSREESARITSPIYSARLSRNSKRNRTRGGPCRWR